MKTGLQQTSVYHSNLSLSKVPQNGLNDHHQGKESRLARTDKNGYGPTGKTNKTTSFLEKIKTDKVYRKKILQTTIVGWAFFFLGWSVGIFGPCFPDLMLLLDEDLETASWLFTLGAFGYLVGSLLGGIFYDRYNKLLLLFVSVVGMSVTNGAIPWCGSLPLMLTMTFLCSTFEGSIETGGNADVVSLWGPECSSFMLAIHFAYSAGGIVSPFVTEPFLAEKKYITKPNTSEIQSRFNSSQLLDDPLANDSASYKTATVRNQHHTGKLLVGLKTSTGSTLLQNTLPLNFTPAILKEEANFTYEPMEDVLHRYEQYGKTNIQYSFLIAAALSLSASLPFLVLYLSSRRKKHRDDLVTQVSTDDDISVCKRPVCLPFKVKLFCLILLSCIMFLYNAIEDNFTGLLMTFSITHLGWSKSHGSKATSLDWASFAVGRFVGIFLVRCIQTSSILTVSLMLLVLSFTGALIASMTLQTTLIWAFVPLAGIAKSVVLPSVFSWTEEVILPVTGKISSLYLVTGSAGSMVTPLLFGYLMEEKGSIWYVYLLLGMSSGCLLAYVAVRISEKVLIRPLLSSHVLDKVERIHLNGVAQ